VRLLSFPSPLRERWLARSETTRETGEGSQYWHRYPSPASLMLSHSLGTLSHKGRGEESCLTRSLARAHPDPIVKQPSFSVLAAGFPREPRILFSISLPKERLCFAPRGSGAPFGAERTVPWQGARDRLASRPRRNGAPLRRLKSLVPHWLRDIDPGPRNGPGGCPPRTPGTAVCENRGRRRRSPSTLSSLCRAPLCGWG
jgi:hypothetical protein